MSLATRCSACGTVFRIVQDQLKVSEGWVRCGRCREVFNALEGLFDLEHDLPPPWPQPAQAPAGAPAAAPEAAPPAPAVPAAPSAPAPTPSPVQASETAEEDTQIDEPTAQDRDLEQEGDFADARFHSEMPEEDSTAPLTVLDSVGDSTLPTDATAPRFLREAERAQRWRRPGVRAALAVASLALAVALIAQVMLHFRDTLAAHWPQGKPFLEAMCRHAGCRIEPLRSIDSLAVDSTGLSTVEGAGLYRFTMVLRNHGVTTVLLPAIELSMTDGQGSLVSRKVVAPGDLGAGETTVAAGADVTLQALLSAGDRRIVGYQVEIFYP